MAGRPSEYRPEFCDTIIAVAERGGSAKRRAVAIGINPSTYYRWIDPSSDHYIPEFHAAHERAEGLCYAWWEKMGTAHLIVEKDGPRLDPQVYRLNMMNRFGWGEKREENQTVTVKARVRIGGGDDE